jgi:epsin
VNEYGNDNNAFLQQQATGFNNNPYLQFQQQQLQQQQLQQQQLMQQQMMQQQMQQQQQMAFLNTMNNPYQQQLVPQMTGAPNLGSNNPFSAFAQKPAMTGQPTGLNGVNGFNSNNNSNGFNNGISSNNSNNNPLGELAFLQSSMTGAPATSQSVSFGS